MDENSSIFTDPNNYYSFTCHNCYWRGDREAEPDYVAYRRPARIGSTETGYIEVGKYPHRCRECERLKKRYSRMRQRTTKIWEIADTQPNKYSKPKFLTFGFPCQPVDTDDPLPQLLILKSKISEAKSILQDNGIKGGVYVYEVTSRQLDDGRWKHHPHVHALVISPYIRKDKLPQWCKQLEPIGLGKINYFAPQGSRREQVRGIANYVSKYMCKDLQQRCASFGIYRGWKPVVKTDQELF